MGNTKLAQSRKKRTGVVTAKDESAVRLCVRLWSGTEGRHMDVPAEALWMVEDFLSAGRGTDREALEGGAQAQFPNAVQAIQAARQIHRLIRSFCSTYATGSMDGCITLSNALEPPPIPDVGLLYSTRGLDPLLPGQVLIAGTLCDAVKRMPGLQFLPLSSGVLLATEDTALREVLHLLAPLDTQAPLDPGLGLGGRPGSDTVVESAHSTPDLHPRGLDGEHSRETLTADIDMQDAGKRPPKSFLIWGAAALTLAGVVAVSLHLIGTSPSAKSSEATPSADSRTAQAVVSSSPVPTPGADKSAGEQRGQTTGKSGTALLGNELVQGGSTKGKPATKPAAQSAAKGKTPDAPSVQESSGSTGAYSAAEIEKLLAMADRDTGDGDYDRAIGEYQKVINNTRPNTREYMNAKNGLAKAKHNRDNH